MSITSKKKHQAIEIDPIEYNKEESGRFALRKDEKLIYHMEFNIQINENHGVPEPGNSEITFIGTMPEENEIFKISGGELYGG